MGTGKEIESRFVLPLNYVGVKGCVNCTNDSYLKEYFCTFGNNCQIKEKESYMSEDANNSEFGFSLVSETELKSYSERAELKLKISAMRDTIMPLLNNLKMNEEKEYIVWPNRVKKINELIDRINSFVD